LETVFAEIAVGGQRVVDMEVRPPYSWLLRLKSEGKGNPGVAVQKQQATED